MATETNNGWPIYNYVAELQDGRYVAEIQSNSVAIMRRHFDTKGRATAWARSRASEMIPKTHWEPAFHPLAKS